MLGNEDHARRIEGDLGPGSVQGGDLPVWIKSIHFLGGDLDHPDDASRAVKHRGVANLDPDDPAALGGALEPGDWNVPCRSVSQNARYSAL